LLGNIVNFLFWLSLVTADESAGNHENDSKYNVCDELKGAVDVKSHCVHDSAPNRPREDKRRPDKQADKIPMICTPEIRQKLVRDLDHEYDRSKQK